MGKVLIYGDFLMSGFVNVPCYIEGQGIVKCSLGFENGVITSLGNGVIDQPIPLPDGAIVLPAFIDRHTHGAGGFDTMDASTTALKNMAAKIASEGTAYFLPTTMTQSKDAILSSLYAVNRLIGGHFDNGARVLGVHLEGPFISKKHCGAQPEEFVTAPNVELFDLFNKASCNNIKILTVAPEEDGALDLIQHLNDLGIVASIGHTSAKFCDLISAVKQGARSVTHTYNAQSPLHHRDIGTVGAALYLDELYTELIAYLVHVSPPAIKLLIKNKPHDKVVLITDSMRAKHLPDGVSELGGQKVIVKNGEARLEDGTLAGSVLKMNDGIKNMVSLGVRLEDAVDFATINVATSLGLEKEIGSIKLGKAASFAVVDKNLDVLYTILDGKIIYKRA